MDPDSMHLNFDQQRIDKLQEMRQAGISLFPPEFDRKDTISEIRKRYSDIGHEKSEGEVTTAGRLYTVRNHGKTIFADLGDEGGRIQLTSGRTTLEKRSSPLLPTSWTGGTSSGSGATSSARNLERSQSGWKISGS